MSAPSVSTSAAKSIYPTGRPKRLDRENFTRRSATNSPPSFARGGIAARSPCHLERRRRENLTLRQGPGSVRDLGAHVRATCGQ
jgi:hypothetical protein